MTSKPQKPRILLDWIAVPYRVVVLGLIAVVIVAGAGVTLYLRGCSSSRPRAEAQEAIDRAEAKLSEAAGYRGDERVDEARGLARASLEEARTAFVQRRWDNARVAAIRSENLSQKAVDMARGSGLASQEVKFFRIEGDVRVKRSAEFAWEPATPKMVLHLGDQVKTSSSASCELIYFDGTRTMVQPGSLLEIREMSEDPATKVRKVREKLNWGEVLASTQKRNVDGSFHEVATEKATARTGDAGELRVAFDKERNTATFDVFAGRVEVAGLGRNEVVEGGERLRASSDGSFATKELLPGVPRLVTPSDERVFAYDDPSKATTTLSWEKVPGASKYHLLISSKMMLSEPLYDADREETQVVIDGIRAGSYYWKVAAISASGVKGPYSETRRFRVSSQRIRDREDTVPPKLEITEFVQTGPMLILNGRTEPGAVLWIDSEKVDVADDGTFYAVVRLRKEGLNPVHLVAQDAAGNETKLTHNAYVDTF